MIICGPFRCATGLLTASHPKSDPPGKFATFDHVDGEVTSYDPEPPGKDKPITYHKKRLSVSDFQELRIVMVAGDVIRIQGETYDGRAIDGAVTELELKVAINEGGWIKNIESGKDGVVLVDDDAEPSPGGNAT